MKKSFVLLLFVLMGLVMQAIAYDAWQTEVSCYGSTRNSPGGCLFGQDAKAAGLFIAWLGLLLFIPVMQKKSLVKGALIVWLIGVLLAVFFLFVGESVPL